MTSPAAQPNIKAYFQKTSKDISCASNSDDIFQNVVVLHVIVVKLSCPSMQYVKEPDCVNKKVLELGHNRSDPQNDAIVDEFYLEAAFVQERKANHNNIYFLYNALKYDTQRMLY